MPQLAPLEWLFLFLLFWCILFVVVICVWWISVDRLSISSSFSSMSEKKLENGSSSLSDNVWNW